MGKIRLDRQRACRTHQRFVRPIEPAQGRGAIGEERRVFGGKLQRLLVGGQRLRHPVELKQRIGAIAERIAVIGRRRQQAVKRFERLLGSAELKQGHAAPVEQLGIVRLEAKALVKADQRPLEMPKRMENESETGKAVGAGKVAFQRFLEKRQRRVEPAAPMIDLAKAVQRVEIVGMVLEEFGVKPFRLAEFAVLVCPPGAADEPRRIWLEAWRRPVGHRS